MRVLLTGSNGQVGTALLDHLDHSTDTPSDVYQPTASYDFTLLDRHPHPDRETVVADVADYDAIRPAFDKQDAVVHLAAAPKPDDPWEEVYRSNIRGVQNVLAAARDADVDSVVFASSHHVMGCYEDDHAPDLYESDYPLTLTHTDPVRPDSYYATSKLFGEHLGRWFSEGRGGSPTQFYALRICNVSGPACDTPFGRAEEAVQRGDYERGSAAYHRRVDRRRAHWCSRRDIAQLADLCLVDETVTFDIFHGVSGNRARWFDLGHAADVLGYDPQDDASEWER